MSERVLFGKRVSPCVLVATLIVGCAAQDGGDIDDNAGVGAKGGGGGSGAMPVGGSGGGVSVGGTTQTSCIETKPTPLDPNTGKIAPSFADAYTAYDLGPIPAPEGETDPTVLDPLGGCTIARDDPDTLLFVARSERQDSAIY